MEGAPPEAPGPEAGAGGPPERKPRCHSWEGYQWGRGKGPQVTMAPGLRTGDGPPGHVAARPALRANEDDF